MKRNTSIASAFLFNTAGNIVSGAKLNGNVDEVKIYNKALTQGEIGVL